MFTGWQITKAVQVIRQGGIIAYPTESVYGLGCDPFNQAAVLRLLQIKQRSVTQGLILIAHDWACIEDLIKPLAPDVLQRVRATWPGPVTWLLPASEKVPVWIRGEHASVAIRLTNHPLAARLCKAWGRALVSTSANRSKQPPLRDAQSIKSEFDGEINYILKGKVGDLARPTPIIDAISNVNVRE